jgi:hypothetical protein
LIDRQRLVKRHNPVLQAHNPASPLSVGNGEFAFTADITGLQSFPDLFAGGISIPLSTMSQWGWHTTPRPAELIGKELQLHPYETFGRQVGYATSRTGQDAIYHYLRKNPHRLHLGQVGFEFHLRSGRIARMEDLTDIRQELDLWTGILTSRFSLDGRPVIVRTACHPEHDLLGVQVESVALAGGQIAVTIAFPAAPDMLEPTENLDEIAAGARWDATETHSTRVDNQRPGEVTFVRKLDETVYSVHLHHEPS